MRRSRRLGLAIACAALLVAIPTASASAATSTIGTPSSGIHNRALLDTYSDFTLVDTGQVATGAGYLTAIDFYAGATGTINFVITDSANTVKYLSPDIEVTQTGAQTYSPSNPVPIAVGDRIGYYTSGFGVIPFDYGGSTIDFGANNSGPPVVGTTLQYEGSSTRTYSLGATVVIAPTGAAQCKRDGWQSYGGLFKNQGDCVSLVATGGKNPPTGS